MGWRARTAALALIAGLAVAGPAAAAVDPPAFLPAKDTELAPGASAEVRVLALHDVTLSTTGLQGVTVACGSKAPAAKVTCRPSDGVVVVLIQAGSTEGQGFLVAVSGPTGDRVAAHAVKVAVAGEGPTQPTALAVTVEGCEWLYHSGLLGCPSGPANGPVTVDLDESLELPAGNGVITGADGAAGEATVADRHLQVSGLDTFGTFAGKLGTGDDALTLTVKRRAPLRVGYLAISVGALLAAALSWFTGWATASAAARATRVRYHRARQAFAARYGEMRAHSSSDAWRLDVRRPSDLPPDQRGDSLLVDAYEAAIAETTSIWHTLLAFVAVQKALRETEKGRALQRWVSNGISSGYHGRGTGEELRALLAHTARALKAWDGDERERLLDATDEGDFIDALGMRRLTLLTDRPRPASETSPSPATAAPPVPASAGAWALRRVVSVRSWLRARPWVAKLAVVLAAWVVVVVIAAAFGLVSGGTARVLAVLGAGLAVVIAVAIAAALSNGWGVAVAGAVGWALAALFGAGDAINSSAAWGTPADVLKALGASFTIGGAAQILRFGFPRKVDAT